MVPGCPSRLKLLRGALQTHGEPRRGVFFFAQAGNSIAQPLVQRPAPR